MPVSFIDVFVLDITQLPEVTNKEKFMGKKLWFLLLLPLILNGCANVKAYSNKDATYTGTLGRLLVSTSLDKTYLDSRKVSQSLSDRLSKHGVATKVIVQNPLELESGKNLKEAASTFKPTQIMELVATSVTRNQYGPVAFTLDTSVYDINTKKRIWRSQILFNGSFGDAQTNADKFVDAVVQKLRTDGLLSST